MGDIKPRRPDDEDFDGFDELEEPPRRMDDDDGVVLDVPPVSARPISRLEMALQRANSQPDPKWQKGFVVKKLPKPVCMEVRPDDLKDAARSELEKKAVYGVTAGVAIYMSLAPLAGLCACGAGMLIGASKS